MKNYFIFLMNFLFIMVVIADVISVKYNCETSVPMVTKSTYQEMQAQIDTPVKTADIYTIKEIN